MRIEKVTSIFVEGVTDVALHRGILKKRFSFKTLEGEEEEVVATLKYELGLKGVKIVPVEQVRFLKRGSHLIIIQGKQGIIKLRRFCEEVKLARRQISDKIEESGIELKSFFIFDNGIPSQCKETPNFMITTSQPTPEEFIFNLLENLLFRKKGEIEGERVKEEISTLEGSLQQLKSCFEQLPLSSTGEIGRKRVNLLKSLIGERCHDHLLDELLELLKKGGLLSGIDPLLPPPLLSHLTQ